MNSIHKQQKVLVYLLKVFFLFRIFSVKHQQENSCLNPWFCFYYYEISFLQEDGHKISPVQCIDSLLDFLQVHVLSLHFVYT